MIYYGELAGAATFQAAKTDFGFIATKVSVRLISGSVDAEICLLPDFSGAHANEYFTTHCKLSPSGGSPYPQERLVESAEGFSQIAVKPSGVTVAVMATR